jgi:hypothetical protein
VLKSDQAEKRIVIFGDSNVVDEVSNGIGVLVEVDRGVGDRLGRWDLEEVSDEVTVYQY